MGMFDYPDPATDPDYCDNHSEQPDADLVCEHCFGTGEIRTDADGPQDCHECDGRGYYQETER